MTRAARVSYRASALEKRRGLVKFLIVFGLLIAFIAGCSVLLRSGGPESETNGGGRGEAATMTFQQFESVNLDTTRDEIIAEFGQPTPREQVIEVGVIPDDPSNAGCIYYRADPPTFGEWFEFCFENDRLTNKTSL